MTDFKSKPTEFLVKIAALLLAPIFSVTIMPVAFVTGIIVVIRQLLWPELYYFRKNTSGFDKSISFIWSDIHGDHDRPRWSMQLVLKWLPSHFKVEKQGDGEHGQGFMVSSWFFGLQLYVTVERMFPAKWFEDIGYDGEMKSYIDRTYGWSIHHWGIWFDWASEDYGLAKHRGHQFNINFLDMLIGRHNCRWETINWHEDEIAMQEGSYPVIAFEELRIDSWERWFSKRSTQWTVIAGNWKMFKGWEKDEYAGGRYIGQEYSSGGLSPLKAFNAGPNCEVKGDYLISEGKLYPIRGIMHRLDEKFLPIPGKGENAWDCEDTGRYSVSFSVDAVINDYHDAVRKFRDSILRDRKDENWTPTEIPSFCNVEKVNVL